LNLCQLQNLNQIRLIKQLNLFIFKNSIISNYSYKKISKLINKIIINKCLKKKFLKKKKKENLLNLIVNKYLIFKLLCI